MKDKTAKKSGKGLRIICILIMIVLLGVIGYCVYNIITIQNEYNESKNAFQAVADLVVKKIKVPSSDDKEAEVTVEIDFEELNRQNKDIFAWIFCDGTPLNYPVVKGKNNDQYLRHLIDGRYNNSGTLFLDSSNSKDLSDAHSFIFGHNMKNGTMFACLLNYSKNGYYEEHPYIYLFTKDVNYRLEVFSAYKTTDSDTESYKKDIKRNDDMTAYFNGLKGRSDFSCDIEYARGDKILTLSTCEYSRASGRYVVHCLIKPVENENK